MTKKNDLSDDVTSLADLTEEQREDIEAMCDDGLMPAQISKRTGVPTRIVADARRSWRRRKELDEKPPAPIASPAALIASENPLAQMMAVTQQQLSQTLLQAQIDAMLEQNRHRKESNKLEERERRLELQEREAVYREEYAPEPPASNDTTDEYDFENDPIGAAMKFAEKMQQKNTPPNAIGSPQTGDAPASDAPLTDEQIAAYMAKQPATVQGKALAAVGTIYEDELIAVLRKNGVSEANVPKVLAWLKAEKARRAQVKK